jgi:hypothetical protein
MGLEPTIPVFERAKTFHALDCTATVVGTAVLVLGKFVLTDRSTFNIVTCISDYRRGLG